MESPSEKLYDEDLVSSLVASLSFLPINQLLISEGQFRETSAHWTSTSTAEAWGWKKKSPGCRARESAASGRDGWDLGAAAGRSECYIGANFLLSIITPSLSAPVGRAKRRIGRGRGRGSPLSTCTIGGDHLPLQGLVPDYPKVSGYSSDHSSPESFERLMAIGRGRAPANSSDLPWELIWVNWFGTDQWNIHRPSTVTASYIPSTSCYLACCILDRGDALFVISSAACNINSLTCIYSIPNDSTCLSCIYSILSWFDDLVGKYCGPVNLIPFNTRSSIQLVIMSFGFQNYHFTYSFIWFSLCKIFCYPQLFSFPLNICAKRSDFFRVFEFRAPINIRICVNIGSGIVLLSINPIFV